MYKRIKKILLLSALIFLISVKPLCAQLSKESNYENRLVFIAQVDEDLFKRVLRYDNKYMYCYLGEGMKLHDDFGQAHVFFGSVASSYRFKKYFKFGYSYYFKSVRSASIGTWNWSHRINTDLTFKYKTGPWQFSVRERLQYTYKAYDPGEFGVRNGLALRAKFQVDYSFTKKFSAYAYTELRNTLNTPDVEIDNSSGTLVKNGRQDIYIDKIKSSACVEYKCTDQVTLCLFGVWEYLRSREWDITDDGDLYAGIEDRSVPAIGVRVKYFF